MKKFYTVCQIHAPSGGMTFVDDKRYNVNAEAQAVADQLMAERKEEEIWEHEGAEFPIYFVGAWIDRGDGVLEWAHNVK